MAADSLITVDEYLRSSYEGDRDFVDGELHKRNWGELRHSLMVGAVSAALHAQEKANGLTGLISVRYQVSPTRIRVPDISFVTELGPGDDILREPPALIAEIVSPQDTFTRLMQKLCDYVDAGVPCLWIIDPWSRCIWTMDRAKALTPLQNETLTLPGASINVRAAELFAELDGNTEWVQAWEKANPWVPGSLDQ